MNLKGTKKKNQVITANIFEQQELLKKAEVIRKNLQHQHGMSWKPMVNLEKMKNSLLLVMTCLY